MTRRFLFRSTLLIVAGASISCGIVFAISRDLGDVALVSGLVGFGGALLGATIGAVVSRRLDGATDRTKATRRTQLSNSSEPRVPTPAPPVPTRVLAHQSAPPTMTRRRVGDVEYSDDADDARDPDRREVALAEIAATEPAKPFSATELANPASAAELAARSASASRSPRVTSFEIGPGAANPAFRVEAQVKVMVQKAATGVHLVASVDDGTTGTLGDVPLTVAALPVTTRADLLIVSDRTGLRSTVDLASQATAAPNGRVDVVPQLTQGTVEWAAVGGVVCAVWSEEPGLAHRLDRGLLEAMSKLLVVGAGAQHARDALALLASEQLGGGHVQVALFGANREGEVTVATNPQVRVGNSSGDLEEVASGTYVVRRATGDLSVAAEFAPDQRIVVTLLPPER